MRSLLFVPGDSPRKLAKGLESGADALILDLEDSVAAGRKAEARATSLAFLKDVGGADKPITIITREEGSGTRGAFQELVMHKDAIAPTALVQNSTGAVREMVHNDPSAIGYISLGQINDEIKAVKISGVVPSEASVAAKQYPLVRPFLFVTQGGPSPATQDFIAFVLSPEGQELVRKEGLIPAR